jgi:hypothetical protein
MLLNGKEILSVKDKKTIEVDVPEWGEDAKVLIGSLGALARARIANYFFNDERLRTAVEDDEDGIVTTDSPDPDEQDYEQDEVKEINERKISPVTNMNFVLEYLSYSILDPQTFKPAFTKEQIEELGEKNKDVLYRLYYAAVDLNLETQKALKEAEKNLPKTTGKGSGGD